MNIFAQIFEDVSFYFFLCEYQGVEVQGHKSIFNFEKQPSQAVLCSPASQAWVPVALPLTNICYCHFYILAILVGKNGTLFAFPWCLMVFPTFHVLIGYSYAFFCEEYVQLFCLFLFAFIIYKCSLYNLDVRFSFGQIVLWIFSPSFVAYLIVFEKCLMQSSLSQINN